MIMCDMCNVSDMFLSLQVCDGVEHCGDGSDEARGELQVSSVMR